MSHIIAALRNQIQKIKCRIANLTNRVVYLEDNCCNGEGDGIQSIQEGEGISIDNTDPQNPIISALGGDTPTLLEVLAEGNNAGEEVIKFEWEIEGSPPLESLIYEIGKDSTTDAFSIRDLQNNRRIDFSGQFDPAGLDLYRSGDNVESDVYEYWEIGYNGSNNSRGLVGSEYFGANYNDNTYVQKKYVDSIVFNYALKKPTTVGTSGQVLTTDGLGSYTWKDAVDWSNLTDKKHLRYDSSLGKPVDSNITDITEGVEVDGIVNTSGVQLNDTTTTPLPNQITRNGDKLKYTDTTGTTRDVMVGFTTSNDGDIEFTGDGTPANPLKADVGNKIPYKAIDTSVEEPDLAQLNAHGTDRVDFPNLNRIYFLNGAKWTYVETIDL